MRKFDEIQSMDIDQLANWFDVWATPDNAPWIDYFNQTYCKNCEKEVVPKCLKGRVYELEYCWCELHDKCKYHQDLDDIPNNVQMIKLWLESECEE